MANGTKCHVFDDGGNFPDTFMTFENVQAFLRITAILVVEAVWDLDALNQEDAADPESELEGVRKVVDVICRRIEAVEKYLEQWRECEAFQNHIAEFDQFIKEARGEVAEMNEKIKEAEKRLKEAREASEASEVKLSDLDPEEWEDCKGMWVMGEHYNGEIFEGIIFSFYQDDVLVRIPQSGSHQWRRADQLILLPDHQRAFSPDGGPVKVDPGQWEKTHAMEEEFDRVKAEEAHAHLRLFHAVTDYAEDSGMEIVGAKFAGGGNAELRFKRKEVK
ncbi:coiled-coil domain-containing protein [Corynebacterium ulcerans]|uniref:coiled-coil domain-containing protein n=1 Tax=Corynebacterium ulcerans TaxID=65058 RepID=UPI00021418CC|nr:coiled-coil domain-containing protein [Corynebacterium ulcerans]AEG84663.1 Coiled-coil domain-containing protein [Corynebacterium ulcerans BR-AD22]